MKKKVTEKVNDSQVKMVEFTDNAQFQRVFLILLFLNHEFILEPLSLGLLRCEKKRGSDC